MSEKSGKILKTAIRLLMIGLMVFSIFFCTRLNGRCFGDEVLTTIGLKAWSNNGHGTHYTVLYSLGIMLIAFLGYALTTKKRVTTFLYFISNQSDKMCEWSLFAKEIMYLLPIFKEDYTVVAIPILV